MITRVRPDLGRVFPRAGDLARMRLPVSDSPADGRSEHVAISTESTGLALACSATPRRRRT